LEIGQRILLAQPTTHLVDGILNWSAPSLKMIKKMSIEKPEVSCELTIFKLNLFSEACISSRENI